MRFDTYFMPVRLEAGRGHGFSGFLSMNVGYRPEQKKSGVVNLVWKEKRGMDTHTVFLTVGQFCQETNVCNNKTQYMNTLRRQDKSKLCQQAPVVVVG